MQRKLITSGSPVEPVIGMSRAVRVGNTIAVAGTAPIAPDGGVSAAGDVHGRTVRCLEIVAKALAEAGASLDDVVRTRVMLTDISTWKDAARAHAAAFETIRPACTFVEVSRFVDPGWLVEIEADAVLS